MKFGFSISIDEYRNNMSNLILSLNKKFKDKINIK